MLVLVGFAASRALEVGPAAAETLLAQRGRATPAPSGRGGLGRERTDAGDARTLVRAQVTAVDPATGRIEMAAQGMTLAATFPPAVGADIEPGRVVYVTVSVIDTRVATVTGSIAAVDQAKGTATVATPGGSFTLTPWTAVLEGMKPGDAVLLKLGLVDLGPPA
jgi:hypothetical protein